VLALEPGDTGLPQTSCIEGHFVETIRKLRLGQRQGRTLSDRRMREVCLIIRRAFDPDAPFAAAPHS
jgi:mRNA-degrading endonuclease toxin of MazEF toxin-antitoxin module